MGQFLSQAFIKVAAASAVSATLATNAMAETFELSVLQSQLNLQSSNTFYVPGIGVRVDEVCETADNGDVNCKMDIIYGGDTRYQEAQATYKTDDQGNLTGITAVAEKGEFFDAQYSELDEKMAALSSPRNDARREQAEAEGFNNITGYNKSRLGDYKEAQTPVYQAMQEDGYLNGTFQLLDGVMKLEAGEGGESFTQTSCTVIPVAGAKTPNYDIEVPESYRSLCVQQSFDRAVEDVTTKVTISGLTNGGELQQASFSDTRDINVIGDANPAQTQVFQNSLNKIEADLNGRPITNVIKEPF